MWAGSGHIKGKLQYAAAALSVAFLVRLSAATVPTTIVNATALRMRKVAPLLPASRANDGMLAKAPVPELRLGPMTATGGA